MKSYLFYADQLVTEYETDCPSMQQFLHSTWGLEIYNGGYLYTRTFGMKARSWYRPDYTPVMTHEVPKELQLLVALLE